MRGLFITFEGNEGSGKTTQIARLAERLRGLGREVVTLREPGGTPIGEEIRHTLKHSKANAAMTSETELLLMNASRAQLVREVIRPALVQGTVVLCDRFYDSTVAYQGYGRGLNLADVRRVIELAVGETRPNLTLLLRIPQQVSAQRLLKRQATLPFVRDRMEEADLAFFERAMRGYDAIAADEPNRVRVIDATGNESEVHDEIFRLVAGVIETTCPTGTPG
jgi:dTMP kinase